MFLYLNKESWSAVVCYFLGAFAVAVPFSFSTLIHSSVFLCLAVALFPGEDNGTAVVLFSVAGSSMQRTVVSKTLHVPEPLSITRYPLLQNRSALCSHCH